MYPHVWNILMKLLILNHQIKIQFLILHLDHDHNHVMQFQSEVQEEKIFLESFNKIILLKRTF